MNKERELDKHEQRDADLRKMAQMRNEMQLQRAKAVKDVPCETMKKQESE